MKNLFTISKPAPVISLRGSESLELLQRISTNDLGALSVGESRETAFLTEKGKVVALATVTRSTEASLLLSGSSVEGSKIVAWIQKFIIIEDIKLDDLSSEYFKVLLYATETDSAIQILPHLPADTTWGGGFHGSAGVYQIHSPVVNESEISDLLRSNGFVSEPSMMFDEFRIMAGIPVAPFELSTSFNPLEAGLENLISWTKGCYVGQEIVARLDTYKKVQRMLMRLEIEELPTSLPTTLYAGVNEIGLVTSATRHRIRGRFHALGYVRKYIEREGVEWSFRDRRGRDVGVSPTEA